MPALACFDVAASSVAVSPPGYVVAWDSASLPAAGPLASRGVPSPATNASAAVHNRLPPSWSIDRSAEVYKIGAWGAPYFNVNESGNVSVRPHGHVTLPYEEIDLMKVVKKASDPKHVGGLGLQLPVLVRFPDVLRNRLESLQSAFDYAIRCNGYDGHYQGVYPVKCNQDRFLVEDIVEFGTKHHFGLEAGSKPELLLAMSCLTRGSPEAFLICNGYKDEEYISVALMARKMGLNTVIVLEQEEDLDTVVRVSRKLAVRPMIGLRAKLRTKHSGHFGPTSGEKGKFGLTTLQILSVVRKLGSLGLLDCLHLLHFHIGSQIPSTALLSDVMAEAAQIYCELARLGADMKVIDVGGGLGIDYDGTHSNDSDMSVGYSLDEYASAVVQAILYACSRKNVPHPTIVSESGRALVSHHSVLVFEAVSSVGGNTAPVGLDLAYLEAELPADCHLEFCNLMAAAVHGDLDTCDTCAGQLKRRCVEQFKEGNLGLEHLTAVDGLSELVSDAMQQAAAKPVKMYHTNLSVFTSVPDLWGIGQLFPIMPIHRLDERPTVDGTLSDLTCDSDGKIDRFIGGRETLPLHDLYGGDAGGGYYLGMFLGGAYQEALGGLHNLFGGPSVVRVKQSGGPHCFAVTRAVPGPSCADILRAVQHEPEVMFETLKQRVEGYVGVGGDDMVRHLGRVLDSMPYLVTSAAVAASRATAVKDAIHWDEELDTSDPASTACDEQEWDIYRCLLE